MPNIGYFNIGLYFNIGYLMPNIGYLMPKYTLFNAKDIY